MTELITKIRIVLLNLYYFSTLKKRVFFGKGAIIRGNVKIGDFVLIDTNVEVRNHTNELSTIGNHSSFNRNTVLRGKYKIGNYVAVGPNCSIMGFNHRFDNTTELISKQGRTVKGIIIEDNVWIGANSVILDGVTIGEGCVIGGGSVITKSIPPFSIAVGNPCKVIKNRKQNSLVI
jgi:acetyltransferase-like isoleucine patch superfamily enzyme